MNELSRKNLRVERVECSEDELQNLFQANPFKIEIINDKIEEGTGSTIYRQGEWYDLCLGPHVPTTSKLMNVKLTSTSSAYWRGDQSRNHPTRIYGIVEPSKHALKETLRRLDEAKKRDHRKLGKDLQLFHIDESVGQGLILWTQEAPLFEMSYSNLFLNIYPGRGINRYSRLTLANWISTERAVIFHTIKKVNILL